MTGSNPLDIDVFFLHPDIPIASHRSIVSNILLVTESYPHCMTICPAYIPMFDGKYSKLFSYCVLYFFWFHHSSK